MALHLFAACAPGTEPLLEQEARVLRLADVAAHAGGVSFTGGWATVARANVGLAVASRVLLRVGSFRATNFDQLVAGAAAVDWAPYLQRAVPVGLRASCHKSRLHHSGAVVERVQNAMAQRLGWAPTFIRAAEDEDHTAQQVLVRLDNDQVTLSVDTSGDLLHRRGWRQAVGPAPLRETLAAALLLASGWEPGVTLWDPFCGSGTVVLEAARRAAGWPPNAQRKFSFEGWHGVPRGVTQQAVQALKQPGEKTALHGSDVDAVVLKAAALNQQSAGVKVVWTQADVANAAIPPGPGLLCTNPPYGARLEPSHALEALAGRMAQLAGWRVAMVAPPELLNRLPVRWERRMQTHNGGLPVVLGVGTPA